MHQNDLAHFIPRPSLPQDDMIRWLLQLVVRAIEEGSQDPSALLDRVPLPLYSIGRNGGLIHANPACLAATAQSDKLRCWSLSSAPPGSARERMADMDARIALREPPTSDIISVIYGGLSGTWHSLKAIHLLAPPLTLRGGVESRVTRRPSPWP